LDGSKLNVRAELGVGPYRSETGKVAVSDAYLFAGLDIAEGVEDSNTGYVFIGMGSIGSAVVINSGNS